MVMMMKNISIWKDKSKKIMNYKSLDKDIECDVLIIGGGITGISTLYNLNNSNLDVVLVEQNKIGMGVTSNSTGKLSYLQDSIYNKIINRYDEKMAGRYLKSQKDAIEMVVDIIKKEKIDCDLEKSKSYLYTNKDNEIDNIKKLKTFLIDNGVKVVDEHFSLVESKYMISVSNTYLFNPLKFVRGLANVIDNSKIYENTSIIKCERNDLGYVCYTNSNIIRCKYVVIASHYPYFNLPYLFPIKGSLEKSYIGSGKKKMENVSLISYSNPYISIRNYKDYMIYLSNSHIISNDTNDEKHFLELEKKIKDMNVNIEYLWSNIDIMTNDSIPYIGRINNNLFIGTGYNAWGLANGVLAGYIISKLIKDFTTGYEDLFDPLRKIKGNTLEILKNSYYNAMGMINGMINKSDKISCDTFMGKIIYIYKDDNKEYRVYSKCPHMGCSLIFNEIEKTWDCPCHGSRFDLSGKCISGPSNKDITVKNTKT